MNSDVVFGLIHLLGMQYRPEPADLPDQKGWRIQDTDYGPLTRFARGKIDLAKIKRHHPTSAPPARATYATPTPRTTTICCRRP